MLEKYKTDENIKAVTTTGSTINRYLQYWVVYAIVSSILSSFSPILAWLPLSTHMMWVLWAYIQLESTTLWMYHVLEWDLMAFGLLHRQSHNEDEKESGVQDAVTMKLINSFLTKVPSSQGLKGRIISNQDSPESVSPKVKAETKTGVEGEKVTAEQRSEPISSVPVSATSKDDDEPSTFQT